MRESTLIGHHPVDAVFKHDRDPLAGLQSFAAKTLAHARNPVANFAPVNAFPFFAGAVELTIRRRIGRSAAAQRENIGDGRAVVEHQVARAAPVLQDRRFCQLGLLVFWLRQIQIRNA